MTDAARALSAGEVARRLLTAAGRGEQLVSVLATTSRAAGARVIVNGAGALEGSLGSATLDAAARECARAAFEQGAPVLNAGLFAELHAVVPQLLVFGAGHIALPLASLGTLLGFQVTVLDDRAEFAVDARFADDVTVRVLDPAAPFAGLPVGANTYVVLVTRAHKHDYDLLRALLQEDAPVRYIGMVGSKRRVRAAFTALLEAGVARAALARIHAPIGLDIGAETPAEIAVSIAAELIAVRRGGSGDSLTMEARVLERFL